MSQQATKSKSILVVLPGLSSEWIIWCVERAIKLNRQGNGVTFLDLSEFNPIRYRRFIRKLIHRIRYRNCIHVMIKTILENLEITYIKPQQLRLRTSRVLTQNESAIFQSGLDAVYGQIIGRRILLESDLPIETVNLEKKLFVAAIDEVSKAIRASDIDEVITVNGRCLVDSAVVLTAEKFNKKVFRLEAGGGTSLNHEIYSSSPFDFDATHKIILDAWNQAGENRSEIAIASLENKLTGYMGHDPYWSLSFKKEFILDTVVNPKIAVFFPTTDFEHPLLDPLASRRTYDGDQIKAFKYFYNAATRHGYQVIVRAHPHPFDKTKELVEDRIWGDVCRETDIIFIPSESGIDSKSLMKVSLVNAVYQSSIAVESIYLSRPTIILGRTEFDNLVPELCAFEPQALNRLFESGVPIIDRSRLYPWAYYRTMGGQVPNFFSKRGDSFFFGLSEIEFNRLRRKKQYIRNT